MREIFCSYVLLSEIPAKHGKSITIHRFRKCPFTPLCIEDAERVGDPILFERPCNPEGLEVILKCVLHEVQRTVPKASILASTLCIEDARSLVLRLDLAKCLAEEL